MKERVKERLQIYIESGNSISYRDMERVDSSLLYAIYKHLGNIQEACNLIGITDKELEEVYGFNIKKKPITEEEVISRISFLHNVGELKTKNLKKDGGYFSDNQAHNFLRREFGSIDSGLSYYGFSNQYKVTAKNIRSRLNNHYNRGSDMSYSSMVKMDKKLTDDIRNRFNSYYDGLDYYGVSYKRVYNVVTRENLFERINNIIKSHNTINYTVTKKRGLFFTSLLICRVRLI